MTTHSPATVADTEKLLQVYAEAVIAAHEYGDTGGFAVDLEAASEALRAALAAPVGANKAAASIDDDKEFHRLAHLYRRFSKQDAFDAMVCHINAWGASLAAGAPAATAKAVLYVRQMDLDHNRGTVVAAPTADDKWSVPLYLAAPQIDATTVNAMCERKTDSIIGRDGYVKTGYVLRKPGADRPVCVSDGGAVSWFTQEQWDWLLFNRDHVEFVWPKPIGAPATAPDVAKDAALRDALTKIDDKLTFAINLCDGGVSTREFMRHVRDARNDLVRVWLPMKSAAATGALPPIDSPTTKA